MGGGPLWEVSPYERCPLKEGGVSGGLTVLSSNSHNPLDSDDESCVTGNSPSSLLLPLTQTLLLSLLLLPPKPPPPL